MNEQQEQCVRICLHAYSIGGRRFVYHRFKDCPVGGQAAVKSVTFTVISGSLVPRQRRTLPEMVIEGKKLFSAVEEV